MLLGECWRLFPHTYPHQATRCGSTEQMSCRRAIPRGCTTSASPVTCSKSTLLSTSGRTGRPTCFLGTSSGGKTVLEPKNALPDASRLVLLPLTRFAALSYVWIWLVVGVTQSALQTTAAPSTITQHWNSWCWRHCCIIAMEHCLCLCHMYIYRRSCEGRIKGSLSLTMWTDMMKTGRPWTLASPNPLVNPGMASQMK